MMQNLLNHQVQLTKNIRYVAGNNRSDGISPYIRINIWVDLLILGISSYTIEISSEYFTSSDSFRTELEKEFIRIPYLPSKDIFTLIKQIDASYNDSGTKSASKRTVDKIKKQIEDKLDEDPILRQSRKFNIIDEIQQLKKSSLPSKEITELQTTTSTVKSDISKLTKLVEDSKYCSVQSSLKISQLLQENKQEKEKHDSELSTMKSSISQLQEDMKMLFRKTSELHYENTLLKKMLEEEKIKTKQLSDSIKESSGLSFTQANTIGQALMQQDVFNCM
jgi:uncharacterized phage infection (PIP) family protein YhgE